MNPEIKALWLTALRSGEYRQGKGALHNRQSRSFCCLGVLCDLAEKAGIVESRALIHAKLTGYGKDRAISTLPMEVMVWAEMPDAVGLLRRPLGAEEYDSLVTVNDEAGYAFEQVADVIEQQF